MRRLFHWLLVLAVLSGQAAVQRHALSHALHDVAAAARGQDGAPPMGHSAADCVAYQAVGPALTSCGALGAAEPPHVVPGSPCESSAATETRVVFDSRAPPRLG